jgi:glycosyltransferase involved in cell wall biosynthesis
MEAFPLVLERVPEARLVVAGANHHTKAGYWESIREAQPEHLPIEFRGYVAEEDIPDLFQSTSLLVMPYDSATGSSGPAHQACEYGIPIVCADIPDLRGMADDEDMAVRFYGVGDAEDLANQIVTVLESHELERQMAEHNFAAGVEMTMTNVVKGYLRWFHLDKCKKAMRMPRLFSRRSSFSSKGISLTDPTPEWDRQSTSSGLGEETNGSHHPMGVSAHSELDDVIGPFDRHEANVGSMMKRK